MLCYFFCLVIFLSTKAKIYFHSYFSFLKSEKHAERVLAATFILLSSLFFFLRKCLLHSRDAWNFK
jgi:hypothetical protein